MQPPSSAVSFPLLAHFGRGVAALGAVGIMAGCLALLAPLVPTVLAGENLVTAYTWLLAYGLDLSFRLDGLGLLFNNGGWH